MTAAAVSEAGRLECQECGDDEPRPGLRYCPDCLGGTEDPSTPTQVLARFLLRADDRDT